jgi:hypothetical protein
METTNACSGFTDAVRSILFPSHVTRGGWSQQVVSKSRIVSTGSSTSPTTIAPGLELLSSILFDKEDTSETFVVSNGLNSYQDNPSSTYSYTTLPATVSPTSSTGTKSKILIQTGGNNKVRKDRPYIEDGIKEEDILCGRGGRSNNHPGNKRYRRVVNEFRILYQKSQAKTIKTDLSRTIVEHCCSYGARFLKTDGISGRYYILTKIEARKKTSQALRETKDLKWTDQGDEYQG